MTTEPDLLPLPDWMDGYTIPSDDFGGGEDQTLADKLHAYARANVAHATAARDAEIEALRAEVEAWRELSDHVRAGACNAIWPDRYTDARTRDVAAALKRAERLAEALRVAYRHLDPSALRVSHCKDLAKIDAALEQEAGLG